ncbi:MAG: hypothetical protein ACKO2P_04410 [Planctomycetota bacterium]
MNRPGARALPEKPAAAAPAPGSSAAAKPTAPAPASASPKPGTPARYGSKMVVDEDDPFGIGAAGGAQVIPAALKPEKGRLQKTVCPMCEQANFIPKTALGKSVRCANPKCMVPVFTAVDPAEQKAERKPTRLSDEAEAQRRAAEETLPRRRSPILLYAVAAVVLVALTALVVTQLNRKPDTTQFAQSLDLSELQRLAEEDATKAAAQQAADQAAAAKAAENPAKELEDNIRRMIALARSEMRDKALARRMTGDLWLRLGRSEEAATEFNQLLVVDKTRGFYRMQPQLARYWRSRAAGETQLASESLQLAETEARQRSFPRTGRAATDAALALATALAAEGRLPDAAGLVSSRQLDRTIPANIDQMSGTAWLFVAAQCRDQGVPAPPALECLLWADPLPTAVAAVLAARGQWQAAIDWAVLPGDGRATADALAAIADRVHASGLPAATQAAPLIEAAAAKLTSPQLRLKVLAATAAAKRDATALQTCLEALRQLPETPAWALPDLASLLQKELPDRALSLTAASAAAETLRAACLMNHPEHAKAALAELRRHLAAAAPPTGEARGLLAEIKGDESNVRRQIQTALRESDAGRLDALYRTAVSRSTSIAQVAEDRRSQFVLLLSRIAASGGTDLLKQSLNDAPELIAELQLDELRGLVAFSALIGGKPLPELAITTATAENTTPRTTIPQMLVELGRVVGASAALDATNPTDALRWIEQGTETLPAVRSAFAAEFSARLAKTLDPPTLLPAIAACKNGLWREECFEIAGKTLAERGLAPAVGAWATSSRTPPQDHIALLYGTGLSLLANLSKPATIQP